MNKRFLIVGLGVLGRSLSKTLTENGCEVIAIDESLEELETVKDYVSVVAQCDATDSKALKQLGADSVDAAIICIGEEFESAVLATAHLLDLGVKFVAARANSPVEESILKRLGAHEIFSVEGTVGKILGDRFSHPSVITEMDIGEGYQILQWKATNKMDQKALKDLQLPKNFEIQVMAVRKTEDQAMTLPSAETLIEEDDRLFLMGHQDKLRAFLNEMK